MYRIFVHEILLEGWGVGLRDAGFRPGSRDPFDRARTGPVAQDRLFFREKDPKPFPPRSATLNRADAGPRRADQLAGLRQGPPVVLSVSPVGRPVGGGQVEPLILLRECWTGAGGYSIMNAGK